MLLLIIQVTIWGHENNAETVFVLVMPGKLQFGRFPGIEYIPFILVSATYYIQIIKFYILCGYMVSNYSFISLNDSRKILSGFYKIFRLDS